MKKKIVFIINPLSGDIVKNDFPELIRKAIDSSRFDVEISFTKSATDNSALAEKAVAEKKDIVVAVGGDGTINHVAKYLAGTGILFGIVPCGSGNGLARHLGIPLVPETALDIINRCKPIGIDTGKANDVFFINAAGVGFDAHVTHMFARAARRGLLSYARITIGEFLGYHPRTYDIVIDGKTYVKDAFILCIANGSQYGNNAWIAPDASLEDGKFNITIIKPFHPVHMPLIAWDMFAKKFGKSRYTEVMQGSDIRIRRKMNEVVNIDGEPVMMEKDIHVTLQRASLNIIVP